MALLLVPVKTLFRHLDATLPKYTQREFDPNFSYALLLLINPILCIALVVPFGALFERFDDYKVIAAGTAVCALATALAMIPSVPALVAFLVLFSVGEMIWSPRLQTYFYALAPSGEEGAFGALASVPLFLAKLPAGLISGAVLDAFCPTFGVCDGAALWGILALTAAFSPLALAAAYCWIARGVSAHMRVMTHGESDRTALVGNTETADGNNRHSVQLDMMTPRNEKDKKPRKKH